ncbi:putative pyridine nucleotide-disulphide oxidoreductase [Lyophyllum shimeji]|uniref:Pyridine nucleotide-disulphide oxidoreductase n=1 Tax=Lyophyllum shimeji TaxID=47721 RepID=A0A9P3PTJ0_LYOSH|nr:putative pyridine nucleotide-disulphide oxidoreductase [Lyophyllum shimeji]
MICNRTVIVLGAAYGGARAAQVLAAGIPAGWRVLLIDRNSHTNHIYIFPRLSVLPGHEHKAFISNTKIFLTEEPPLLHRRLQATVTSISQKFVTLSRAFPEHGLPTETVAFDYLVYALGSHLPAPLNLWGTDSAGIPMPRKPSKDRQLPVYNGMKTEGIAWIQKHQKIVEDAPTVLVVGGGALGIQFATDIATIHPTKKVTLLHSRNRLLPRFDPAMHSEILDALDTLDNVTVILGERLDLSSVDEEPVKTNEHGQRIVRTATGREIAADLILLCTGQTPNTGLLKEMDPDTVNPDDGLAHVLRTMQLGVLPRLRARARSSSSDQAETAPEETSLSEYSPSTAAAPPTTEDPEEDTPYPHIFVIGDAADAFGAIPAGHNAYYQAEVAARNVIRLIRRSCGPEANEPLEHYAPGPPAIKVTLGLGKAVFQSRGVIGRKDGEPDDLDAASMWPVFGIAIRDEDQMQMVSIQIKAIANDDNDDEEHIDHPYLK